MTTTAKIYVAGHSGLVGSALLRRLIATSPRLDIVTRSHAELDLTDPAATEAFFAQEKPEYVYLAAARVGGILANSTYPAEFIRDNLAIQDSVIHAAWKNKVKRLLFLGSSCIYPKLAPQPMKEEALLTGPLEASNRPYALAKIAGIEMCWSYNRQYGTRYLAVMPTNLYGPGDNYNLDTSHVIPALIRKFHEAKHSRAKSVVVWGTGTPRREFLYSEDMADACVYLMNLPDDRFDVLLGVNAPSPQRGEGREAGRDEAADEEEPFSPPLINIGCGSDISIVELAETVKAVVGYSGEIVLDISKPDGTPRKLMDVAKLSGMGWTARTSLQAGLARAYGDFLRSQHKGIGALT
jgi:GDP-L-fucose synthase